MSSRADGVLQVLRTWVRTPSCSRAFAAGFLTWAIIGTTWALTSPQFSVPDEPAHVVRAASVAGGELLGDRVVVELPGPPMTRRVDHHITVPLPFTTSGTAPLCFIFARGSADCAAPLPELAGEGLTETTAGAYQPLFYGAVGWPMQVMGPNEGFLVARLLHVLAGAVALGAATATAWDLGGRLFVGVLMVGITPMTPYLLGSVNPNGLEIAAAMALWAGALGLVLRAQTRYAVITSAAISTLAWTRPLSPLIAIGILAVVLVAAASPARLRALRQPVILLLLGIGLLALVAAFAWLSWAQTGDAFVATPDPAMVGRQALRSSWEATPLRVLQMIGYFGWLDAPLPGWVAISWVLVVLGLVALGLRVGWWRDRFVLVSMLGATLLMGVVAEVLRAAQLGLFWQGRYTLPVAVGLLVLTGWVLSRSNRVPDGTERAVVAVVAVLSVVGHVTGQVVAMARHSLGPGAVTPAWLWQPGWEAPVPDAVVGLLILLGALAVVATVVLVDATPAPPTRPRAGPAPHPSRGGTR